MPRRYFPIRKPYEHVRRIAHARKRGRRAARHLNPPLSNRERWAAHGKLPDGEVREAVLRNVVAVPSQFAHRLERLAETLRRLDPGSQPADWRAVVEVWHYLAHAVCPAVTLDTALAAFALAFERCDPASPTWLERQVKAAAARVSGTAARLLAVLARLGQLRGRFVHLACRTAAALVGCSPATAARHLRQLADGGGVVVRAEGRPHPYERAATVYDVAHLVARSAPPAPLPLLFNRSVREFARLLGVRAASPRGVFFLCLICTVLHLVRLPRRAGEADATAHPAARPPPACGFACDSGPDREGERRTNSGRGSANGPTSDAAVEPNPLRRTA